MKQKLLLALLALFTGVGTLSAQTWTGSEVSEGTYYLYNVGADKFLAYGASWGTQAIIDDAGIPVQLVNNNGTYRIQTNVTGTSGKVFLGADFYIDQDPCDFTFTTVEGFGEKHVYTLSYMHSDGNTRYRMWVTGAKTFDQVQSVAAGGTWTLQSLYWMLISKDERDEMFASGNPMDITYKYIENPNTAWFTGCYSTNNSWQGTGLGGFNGRDGGSSYRDRNTEHYSKNFDTYIEATDVPAGKYRFSLSGYYRDGKGATAIQNYKAGTSTLNAKIYANENTTDIQSIGIGMRTSKAWDDANESSAEVDGTTYYVPNGQDVATFYFNDGVYPMQSVDVIVSNGTLRFGMKKETTIDYDWTVFDKFRLTYVDPAISAKAVALPEDGVMVAGQWYYFTIPVEANYTLTSENLSGIVYTTSGKTTLMSEESTVTSVFDAADQTLSAGTYYVKSSTDNNLTMALNAFSYVVGEPATSIANGATLQSLTTFTATFNDAATNDPDATFALLNNEAKAQLTKDGSVVAEGMLSLEKKALTATFPETTFELGGAYILTIPSGVVGYNDQASNEEIIVNISTPAIADGYYFLRDSQGRYVGRGSSYNTRALMEPYGLPMHVETNGEGITTFTFIDSNQKLFDAGSGTVYTDNTSNPNWRVETTNGGYYIINKNNNGSLDKKLGTDGGTWMQSNDNGLVWTFEPASEHNTYMEALKDQQAVAAATAAGIEGITNRSTLEAKLASDYIPQTISIDDVAWNEKYQVGAGTEWDGNGVKYYENSVNNLKPGLYKLTAKAFYRLAPNTIVEAASGARGNVYLYGNNVKTQLYSVFDFPADDPWIDWNDYQDANGKYYPNNPDGGQAAFNAGNYVNELYVYINADEGAETGSLNYGIHQPSRFGANQQWCGYQNFTLTYYSDNNDIADAEDYATLNAAIGAAEAKTLGFEANEFAPYNNIAALEVLAAAKSIDQEAINSKEFVTEATTALTSVPWTPNTEEVNGIYDGFFTIQTVPSSNTKPLGWNRNSATANSTGYEDTGYQTRIVTIPNDVTASNVGMMTKMHAFYGDQVGYTLPLKADTYYTISFKYCGWNNTPTIHVNVYNSTEKIATSADFTSKRGDNDASNWTDYSYTFKTTTADNYVIGLIKNSGATDQNQAGFTELELKKTRFEDIIIDEATYVDGTVYEPVDKFANVTLKRTLVEGWNGLVLPFDMTVEDAKTKFNATLVKDFTGVTYDADKGATLVFSDATEIKAGKPFMIKSAAGTEYTFEGVQLKSDALQTISQQAGEAKYTMTGTYQKVDLTNVNFVLIQGDKFYQHNTNKASSAKAFRAYFLNESTGEALSKGINIDFNGEATGIKLVEDAQNSMNGDIYNLQGQKVNHAQKGVYIVNGKKIVVK